MPGSPTRSLNGWSCRHTAKGARRNSSRAPWPPMREAACPGFWTGCARPWRPLTPIDSLAARAAMSPRTLQREFRAATGLAPYQWLIRQRVARARELLETSRLGPERIAELVGLGSGESLRHHFRRQVGISPGEYRRRFARRG